MSSKVLLAFQDEFNDASIDRAREFSSDGDYIQEGLGIDSYFLFAADPKFCLDVCGKALARCTDGAKVQLWEKKIEAAERENQIWQHGMDGRIFLAACPQLCLTADLQQVDETTESPLGGFKVHIEHHTGLARDTRVHQASLVHSNQVWKAGPDETIVLAARPDLCLCIDALKADKSGSKICVKGLDDSAPNLRKWHVASKDSMGFGDRSGGTSERMSG